MRGADFERDGAEAMHNVLLTIPCMKPLIARSLLWMGLLTSVVVAPVSAQPAPQAPVEVLDVKFNPVRTNSGTWYETEVQVQPRGSADNRQFVNRVKVTLNLGVFSVKAPPGAKVPDTYYRSSAEAVAIEGSGSRVSYRFYLPPEIVKRDQITGDQRFYLVELSVNGQAVPLAKNQFPAATFNKPEVVESFRSKVASEAGSNDGVLLPQHLSPFAFDGSRPAPSCIRIENTR